MSGINCVHGVPEYQLCAQCIEDRHALSDAELKDLRATVTPRESYVTATSVLLGADTLRRLLDSVSALRAENAELRKALEPAKIDAWRASSVNGTQTGQYNAPAEAKASSAAGSSPAAQDGANT